MRNIIGRKIRLNSSCLRGRNVMEVSSKKTATRLNVTSDHEAFVIYQMGTQLLNRLIIRELYDYMMKLKL